MSFSIYILTWLQSAIFYLFTSFLFLCPIFNLPFYVFTWLRGVIYPSVSFKLVTLCHFLSFYMSFQHVPAVLPVWAGDDVKRQSEGERERERATNTEVYKSEESWRENAQFVNNCKSDRSDPPPKKMFFKMCLLIFAASGFVCLDTVDAAVALGKAEKHPGEELWFCTILQRPVVNLK